METHCSSMDCTFTVPGYSSYRTQSQAASQRRQNAKLELLSKSQRRSSTLLRVLQLHAVRGPSAFDFINTREGIWSGGEILDLKLKEHAKEKLELRPHFQNKGLFLSLLDSLLPHFIFHPLLELPGVDVRSTPLWRAEIRDSTAEC